MYKFKKTQTDNDNGDCIYLFVHCDLAMLGCLTGDTPPPIYIPPFTYFEVLNRGNYCVLGYI